MKKETMLKLMEGYVKDTQKDMALDKLNDETGFTIDIGNSPIVRAVEELFVDMYEDDFVNALLDYAYNGYITILEDEQYKKLKTLEAIYDYYEGLK